MAVCMGFCKRGHSLWGFYMLLFPFEVVNFGITGWELWDSFEGVPVTPTAVFLVF